MDEFDRYLKKYYGFSINDRRWKTMANVGKALLKDSYRYDLVNHPELFENATKQTAATTTKKEESSKRVATTIETGKLDL